MLVDSNAFKAETNCRIQVLAGLKECSRTRDLAKGKTIHAQVVECGLESNIYVASALINMYAKCGCMLDARLVFDDMKHPDVVSWNALILGYAENGQGFAALYLFRSMQCRGLAFDSITFVAAVKACTSLAVDGKTDECRRLGGILHDLAVENGLESNAYLQNTLIDMYGTSGSTVLARQVFDIMIDPDVVSWNALILGYAENGEGMMALNLFKRMSTGGCAPDSSTFVGALKGCTSLAVKADCLEWGKQLHNLAIETGSDSSIYVQSALIELYAKRGSMLDAHRLFSSIKHPNVVCWNVLILGYADNGQDLIALDLFRRMRRVGLAPDSVTFLAALKACVSLGGTESEERGKTIHTLAVESGCDFEIKVQSTLIDMYAKCNRMADARQVFDNLRHPNVVCWSALSLGYAENGQGFPALDLFMRMKKEGPAPDSVAYVAAIKACALVGGLEFGRTIHAELVRAKDLDAVLVTCLVDFYSKCGSLVEAKSVFDLHAGSRDVVTWTTMLSGFSSSGDHEAVFELFERMRDADLLPTSVTFLCILTCCGHAGLVEKGKECFDAMSEYGIAPAVEHFNCMVDIFGRARKLDEALALLQSMPCSPNDVTWMCILGACVKCRNVEIGRIAFQSLTHLSDKDAAAAYVILGQIYWSKGMLQEQEMVLGMQGSVRARKNCWTNEVLSQKIVPEVGMITNSFLTCPPSNRLGLATHSPSWSHRYRIDSKRP